MMFSLRLLDSNLKQEVTMSILSLVAETRSDYLIHDLHIAIICCIDENEEHQCLSEVVLNLRQFHVITLS